MLFCAMNVEVEYEACSITLEDLHRPDTCLPYYQPNPPLLITDVPSALVCLHLVPRGFVVVAVSAIKSIDYLLFSFERSLLHTLQRMEEKTD